MAKESMKAREVKRAKLVARYAEKRAALKKVIATSDDPAEAYEAARKLQAIPNRRRSSRSGLRFWAGAASGRRGLLPPPLGHWGQTH